MKKLVLFVVFNFLCVILFATNTKIMGVTDVFNDGIQDTYELIVTINSNESSKWIDYSPMSFGEVDCIKVEDLTAPYNPSMKSGLNSFFMKKDFMRILRLTIRANRNINSTQAV